MWQVLSIPEPAWTDLVGLQDLAGHSIQTLMFDCLAPRVNTIEMLTEKQ